MKCNKINMIVGKVSAATQEGLPLIAVVAVARMTLAKARGYAGDMGRKAPDISSLSRGSSGLLAPQRIGGAYCSPPLVHSALSPRAILSAEPGPTLRSNTSP